MTINQLDIECRIISDTDYSDTVKTQLNQCCTLITHDLGIQLWEGIEVVVEEAQSQLIFLLDNIQADTEHTIYHFQFVKYIPIPSIMTHYQ
ncbi:hypothetical protein [Flectobacillus major]|jgi:hypothetical protein|uniref:hypothetical protein n=1 Tax=Flectobacillus major TaxID=103 RepID=UPI0005C45513|nr:hypothetical protein [Flectobacillus major]